MRKRLLMFLLLLTIAGARCFSQSIPDDTNGRLWGLCKIWGYMRYYHPMGCPVQWDSLLNANIPLVTGAGSNADYNEVLLNMVNTFGQIPLALATPVPAGDSNLNLDMAWIDAPIFDAATQDFLDTFYNRAGRNDSIFCQTAYTFFNDTLTIPLNFTNEANRLTTAFHFWNTFSYFAPYKQLTDTPWDSTLLHAIPELRAAPGRLEFERAFARMHTRIDDSHGGFRGTYPYFITNFALGLRIQSIENKAVVTGVYPGVTNVNVGDVVLEADGHPIDSFIGAFRPYIPSSNDSRFYYSAYPLLIAGQGNTTVSLKLEGAGQQQYTTTMSRTVGYTNWYNWAYSTDNKPEWAVLCNDYGYVNMEKLTKAHIPEMYEDLRTQPAIIFDVRSYLNDAGVRDLAPLFFEAPVPAAITYYSDIFAPGRFRFGTDSGNLGTWVNPDAYAGKVYFLVNEEAISASEYFVQCMSRIPGSKVVGSQTAGADGGNIAVWLTPDLLYAFTATGIAYLDGYQCQRNGLRIDSVVKPTIQGVRAGRDEVLESISGCPTSASPAIRPLLQTRLYPNPAADKITISIVVQGADKATIGITDVMGRTVYRQNDRETGPAGYRGEVDISHWRPGIYFVKVNTAKGGEQVVKLVKR